MTDVDIVHSGTHSTKPNYSRPVGIIILALFEFLKIPYALLSKFNSIQEGDLGISLILLVIGGIHLLLSWGIWNAKKWAYSGLFLLTMLSVINVGVYAITEFQIQFFFPDFIWLYLIYWRLDFAVRLLIWLISQLSFQALIIYYLTRLEIKTIFQIPTAKSQIESSAPIPFKSGVDRPTGIVILAIFEFMKMPSAIVGALEGGLEGVYILMLLIGGIHLILGWALWNMKKWAYPVTIILGLLIIFSVVLPVPERMISGFNFAIFFPDFIWYYLLVAESMFTSSYSYPIWLISQLISQAVILYYLSFPRIKRIFGVVATKPGIDHPTGIVLIVILEFLKLFAAVWLVVWMRSSLMLFTLGLIHLIVGWGLWNTKKWAYLSVIILTVISFISGALLAINFDPKLVDFMFYMVVMITLLFEIWITPTIFLNMVVILQLISQVIILYYLTRSRIKKIFTGTGIRP